VSLRTLAVTVTVAVAVGSTVSACGEVGSGAAGGPVSAAPMSAAPSASSPSRQATPPDPPPGDPGLDASAVPDPGSPGRGDVRHGPARRSVPAEAMLDAGTVSGVLGGRWQASTAAGGLDCPITQEGLADRTAVYRTEDGYLREIVTTHRSPSVADGVARDADRRMRACGWAARPDPRLGSASSAAEAVDTDASAVVVAVEGVTVTLVGSGAAVANQSRWSSVADVALGNACAAASEGCH
jgi:hypothetical protein